MIAKSAMDSALRRRRRYNAAVQPLFRMERITTFMRVNIIILKPQQIVVYRGIRDLGRDDALIAFETWWDAGADTSDERLFRAQAGSQP